MQTNSSRACKTFRRRLPLVISILMSSASFGGVIPVPSDVPQRAEEVGGAELGTPEPLADASIEAWRRDLLHQAFEIASVIPVSPHVKDRSRTQADVVAAMLELDQPRLAESTAMRIENWRRAEALARLAVHAARKGADPRIVRMYVEASDANHPQDLTRWRHDRIDVNLAIALFRIGDLERAARLESGFEPGQQGRLVQEGVDEIDSAQVPALLEQLDRVVASGQLDLVLNTLDILVALHDRFYDEVSLRTDLERRVDDSAVAGKVPHDLRVKINLELVDQAVAHGDRGNARMLVGRARGVLDAIQARTPFPPEYLVPLIGEVAQRRAASGDLDRAREEIEEALRIAEENRHLIVDVFRAGTIRPVAIASSGAGDPDLAHRVFSMVVEAGAENPNARPRAEDLARTLAAMAVVGFEPRAPLADRMSEITSGLVDPW